MKKKLHMKNILRTSIVPLLAGAALLALSAPALAQHAVRDDFPNGKEQGVTFEHFTKEQWEASNFASPDEMQAWQDRRYGMFIHFGITSRANKDLSWGSISQRYAPDSQASWPMDRSARRNGRPGRLT